MLRLQSYSHQPSNWLTDIQKGGVSPLFYVINNYTTIEDSSLPEILYLHGANMSDVGFTYIKSVIGRHKHVSPEYSIHTPLKDNIKTFIDVVHSKFKKPVTIISHSLGGIIAVELYRAGLPIKKIVTLSTPFGGSEYADKLRWFYPSYQLFNDIRTSNSVIKGLQDFHVDIPMLSFVTTDGNTPLIDGDNDGVVTVESQRILSGPTYKEIPLNHFEILLSDKVAKQIKTFVKK